MCALNGVQLLTDLGIIVLYLAGSGASPSCAAAVVMVHIFGFVDVSDDLRTYIKIVGWRGACHHVTFFLDAD